MKLKALKHILLVGAVFSLFPFSTWAREKGTALLPFDRESAAPANPVEVTYLGNCGFLVRIGGKKFLFDHHDINPELYEAKFGRRDFFWKLMVWLERMTFKRVGGTKDITVSVRIISATNQDLQKMCEEGRFREDLYYRLKVVPLRVPPLRERREDILALAKHFLYAFSHQFSKPFQGFSPEAEQALLNYPWPGNIRELKNFVHRALVRGGPEEVPLEEIEREIASQSANDEPLVKQDLLALPLREAREHFERAYLTQQLQLCGGKVGQLAKRVGMERTHLYRKLRSLGVDFRQSED